MSPKITRVPQERGWCKGWSRDVEGSGRIPYMQIKVSKFQSSDASKFQCFQIRDFQTFKAKIQRFEVATIQSFEVSKFRKCLDNLLLNILIPYYNISASFLEHIAPICKIPKHMLDGTSGFAGPVFSI